MLGSREGRPVEPCEDAVNGDHCSHWYGEPEDQKPCCTCGNDSPDGLGPGPACMPALNEENE